MGKRFGWHSGDLTAASLTMNSIGYRVAAGAIPLDGATTLISTVGGANALTLANGIEGQIKVLAMIADAGDGTVTPDNLANGSTILFDDVGDCAILLFINGEWYMLGGTATLA